MPTKIMNDNVSKNISLIDLIYILFVLVLSGVILFLLPEKYVLPGLIGVGIVFLFILWAHLGDLMTLILVWLITVACFSYFYWRSPLPIPGISLNVTVDRLLILAILLTAIVALLIKRIPYKPLPKVVIVAFIMAIYFTISMAMTGFKSIADVKPHFRLIGGYYFPIIVMVLAYWSVNDEPQIKKISWLFFWFGLYLTITAWAEKFHIWSIVFPKYIADPKMGIHWGRARGPFLVSASLGITLVFCFFNNLYLAGRTRGVVKVILYSVNIIMIPAIFFTYTRSVWLAMIVCSVVWVLASRKVRNKMGVASVLLGAAILTVAVFHTNLLSRQRTKGGWMDPHPIYARLGLVKITGNIFKHHPLTGVGFGHFRDYAAHFSQDPTSKYIRFGSRLMEHNNFLSILAETGLVGLGLYLWMLWLIYKHSKRLHQRIPAEASGWVSRDLVVLFWILLIDYLIDGMFRETSVDPFNNGLLFMFVGVTLAVDYLLDYRPSLKTIEEIVGYKKHTTLLNLV